MEYKYETKETRIKKYIDIDSSFRNRSTYPLQSNFVIKFNNGGQRQTLDSSFDPISLAMPYETGTTGVLTVGTTGAVQLPTTSSSIDNFYIGDFVQISFESRPIVGYTGSTFIASVDPFFSSSVIGDTNSKPYAIRRSLPMNTGTFQAGSTNSTLFLDSNSNSSFAGNFIRIRSGSSTNDIRPIKSFSATGTNRVATVAPGLGSSPILGDSYEILGFTVDNESPLIFSGTSIFSQPVCYKIRLLSLSIPRQTLSVGYGGTIVNYPYLYVKFYNDNHMNSENILYSNNQASRQALIKVPMLLLNYNESSFIALSGAESEQQTVKFKPNDSLRFAVTLPNGEYLNFVQPDTSSPLLPNPLLQISALFEIERID